MAAKKNSKTAAQQKKIAALAVRLDKSLKKVGDPKVEAEIRDTLKALAKAHSELYQAAVGDRWIDAAGWIDEARWI